jgi:hypothetical protein
MKTGMESSPRRWSLFDAIAFLTGGEYRPPPADGWETTDKNLRDRELSGMEYCVYLMYFSVMRDAGKASLRRRNFINSPTTLDTFLEWKAVRGKRAKDMVKRQRESFQTFLDTGYSLKRVLLENFAELSAPVMFDLCLQNREVAGDEWDRAMGRCAEKAFIYALGCPEYLWYCPYLDEDLNKGDDSELRRKITEAGGVTTPPVPTKPV